MEGDYGMILMEDGGVFVLLEQLLAYGGGFRAPSLRHNGDHGHGCVSTCGIQDYPAGLVFGSAG